MGVAACYAGVLVLGMVIGPKFAKENSNTRNGSYLPFGSGRSGKIEKILQIIDDNYVDPIQSDTLQSLAIGDILKKLDPHSAYLPAEDAQSLKEGLEGNFDGIGIEYFLLNDTVLVTRVYPDGPAATSGLERGDRIIEVDRQNITGPNVTTAQISAGIRGIRGSGVDLLVRKNGTSERKKIHLVRDNVQVSSIDAAYLLNPTTGYVKIKKFGARTAEDFVASMKKLQQAGMQNLVLDLRDNGGGYLNAATALADEFLGDKKLIVYTEGEHERRTDYLATAEGGFEKGGLVVLIDENTASASEIVAGAVQDLDRGTVIGRRSFGKGLVQEQFAFGDGSALNLTIARYYTPSGRSIQRSYKKGSKAYYEEVNNRYRNGEFNGDGKYADSLYDKDKTFKTAGGRTIYGGGGIMPDIYVPIDTTGYSDFHYQLMINGLLSDFSYRNLANSRQDIPASAVAFVKNFTISEAELDQFFTFVQKKGIKASEPEIVAARPLIAKQLKAILARYYFGDDGYYRVVNAGDKAVAKSLEVLGQKYTSYRVPGAKSQD